MTIYQYKCKIVSIDGKSAKQNMPLVFDMNKMLLEPEALDKQLHYVEVDLMNLKGCSSQTQIEKETKKKLTLDFKFDVDLETFSTTEANELEHSFFDKSVVFKHQYKIENSGTSPSSKNETFYLYIPEVAEDLDIRINEDQAICHENKVRKSDLNTKLKDIESSEISCYSNNCRHECMVKPGLVKQNPLVITLAMTLDPKQNAIQLFEREQFKVITKLELNGKEISSATEFEKNEVGKLEVILQWWPIILGVAIAAAVFGACVYGLIKSGLFEKMRRYNDFDDPGMGLKEEQLS